jgi:fatty-acyl-CoA synthase
VDLADLSRYWRRWQPKANAIRFEGRDLTWQEFDDRTESIAAGLAGLGFASGDRLGILGNNSPAWCELTVAAFKLGLAVVPLNIRLSPAELAYIIGHAGCRGVAVDGDLAERYDQAAKELDPLVRIRMEDAAGDGLHVDELAATGPPASPVEIDEGAPALVAYTSGTTGRPKGAVLTHRNLLAHISLNGLSNGWGHTKTLLCVPLAFTGGIVNNFVSTYGVGGTLVLERTFDPARALAILTGQAISVMIGVPIMWQGIAAAPGFAGADLSALTTAITGGAPVPEGLLRTYQAKGVAIRQAYALTEASGIVTQLPATFAVAKPKAAGMPVMQTRLRIVDAAGQPCPPGETGEILVQGPQVMAGYWADPEATAAAFVDGWLRTGDLGRLDDDGLLEVVDRKHDLIISGGLNVYPAEIERVLSECPGLVEVAVVGVPHDRWGEVPLAIVRGDGPVDEAVVVAHCRAALADYKAPRYVVVVEEPLPRSMSGKVLRRELRAEYQDITARRSE